MADAKILSPEVLLHIAKSLNLPLHSLIAVIGLLNEGGTVVAPGNTIVPSLGASSSDAPLPYTESEHYTTTPPQQGIAPDLAARSGIDDNASAFQVEDRGVYHVADAMKSMYDMGDSPSCATYGAIMTRSGSCYRCMSCGSTSGCS